MKNEGRFHSIRDNRGIQANILVKVGECGRLLKQYAAEGVGERVRPVGVIAGSSHASRRAKLQRGAR